MTITDSAPTTWPTTGELTSIANMLAARFPDLSRGDVDDAVHATYDRLDSTARVRGHLFALTANRARVILEQLSKPSDRSTLVVRRRPTALEGSGPCALTGHRSTADTDDRRMVRFGRE
ncbi:hypothetical protein NY08_2943 [Rhodococcus sp. B7740]|uniref:three-helix bundle dimerization domain-containing protein n=1 Tax=Rhodococcus sp. B7740 TaxID=1564114 RepID=UPI0005D743DF|nr:hypothetical protein [Rhodococcus sp. B7740]AJW40953.1 hypothetical protein NY08_2943 [Rhodococcus sp. B7740]